MKSSTSERFWKYYADLLQEINKQAKEAYAFFMHDPYYPSLHFKLVHSTRPIFSVRINMDYRADVILEEDEITWFWIGSHSDYDKLLKQLRSA